MKTWEKYKKFLLTGEWHIHTNYTDGKNSVFEICEIAEKLKIPLIAFTEHVRKKLEYDFDSFLNDIMEAKEKYNNLIILSGCEAKVLSDGSLNVDKKILKKVDYPTFAFHSFPYEDVEVCREVIKKIIKNKYINTWVHPATFLNKVCLKKEETEELFELLKKYKVLFELNRKYKLDNRYVSFLKKYSSLLVRGNDIHSIYDMLKYEK